MSAQLFDDEPDPLDPTVWWRMLVDAVIGFRRGNFEPGNVYMRFVKKHRGVAMAKQVPEKIKVYAAAEKWDNVESWPAWGYRPTKPLEEKAQPAKRSRRKR